MFHFCKNNQYLKLLIATSFLAVTGSVLANKLDNQFTDVISTIQTNAVKTNKERNLKSVPNSSVVLDFSITTGESWGEKDNNNNIVANCFNGDFITGFEYNDVTIQTVGGSFFSEAVVYFSDSNNGSNGQRVSAGAGDESSGTKTFNSNGIFDLTDLGLEDIESLSDGVFLLQLFEKIDDIQNDIDAKYTNGTITVWGTNLEPTNSCPFLIKDNNIDSDLTVEYTTNQTLNYQLNETIEFSIAIENNGAGAATNVRLYNTISEKLAFNQMSCSDGASTTDSDDIISLNVQDIAGNGSLVCTIESTIIAYGFIENSVTATTDNDSNLNNNSAIVMVNGAHRIVPVNNYLALLVLAFAFIYFARKRISKNS